MPLLCQVISSIQEEEKDNEVNARNNIHSELLDYVGISINIRDWHHQYHSFSNSIFFYKTLGEDDIRQEKRLSNRQTTTTTTLVVVAEWQSDSR